jgi:rsbT co-antagonist protein RsbR
LSIAQCSQRRHSQPGSRQSHRVPVVDSAIANHLCQTVRAARLMGAETIVSGLSADAALALARLGADLCDITSVGTLQDAVAELTTRTRVGADTALR